MLTLTSVLLRLVTLSQTKEHTEAGCVLLFLASEGDSKCNACERRRGRKQRARVGAAVKIGSGDTAPADFGYRKSISKGEP